MLLSPEALEVILIEISSGAGCSLNALLWALEGAGEMDTAQIHSIEYRLAMASMPMHLLAQVHRILGRFGVGASRAGMVSRVGISPKPGAFAELTSSFAQSFGAPEGISDAEARDIAASTGCTTWDQVVAGY
jgi:hypothetical protein